MNAEVDTRRREAAVMDLRVTPIVCLLAFVLLVLAGCLANGEGASADTQPTQRERLVLQPSELTMRVGDSATLTIDLNRSPPFDTGIFAITAVLQVDHAGGSLGHWDFSAPDIGEDQFSSRATFSVGADVGAGRYRLLVLVTDGLATGEASVRVDVLSVPPAGVELLSGLSGEFGSVGFGSGVALSADGSRLVAGSRSGYARVFQRNGSTWSQLGGDIESVQDSVAISADGSRIAVVSYSPSGLGFDIRSYELVAGRWTPFGERIADLGAGKLVLAMSPDGATMAVGFAPEYPDYNGRVAVHELRDGRWTFSGPELSQPGQTNSYFAQSIAISGAGGRLVAVGAPGEEFSTSSAGVVYVYDRYLGGWLLRGTPIVGEAIGDNAGAAVAISASGRVAIGAPRNAGATGFPGALGGHVRVYEYADGWRQVGSDIDGDVPHPDPIGHAVAISADGSRVSAAGRLYSSHLHFFENGAWRELGIGLVRSFMPGGAYMAISADGKIVAVGDPSANDSRGHVSSYRLNP